MEATSKGTFRLAGREFPKVTWYKDPAMRKNYICLMFVVLTSVSRRYLVSRYEASAKILSRLPMAMMALWSTDFRHLNHGKNVGLFLAELVARLRVLDFDNPHGSLLGIFNAIMSIGSLCALPFVPYIADYLGRRMGILIGCLIMLGSNRELSLTAFG